MRRSSPPVKVNRLMKLSSVLLILRAAMLTMPEWADYGELLAPGMPPDGHGTGENHESLDTELSTTSDWVYLQYPK